MLKGILFPALLLCCNCYGQAQTGVNIIPWPQQVETGNGDFTFTNTTTVTYDLKNKALTVAIAPLLSKLSTAAGFKLKTVATKQPGQNLHVQLTDKITALEGYELKVTPGGINISAKTPTGIFYAVQSLLQLLPVEIESNTAVKNIEWKIPSVVISDAPVFAYRGLMLDVARHYMPYDFIKKLIDLMSMQKMNTLHLHLTDSQGWRFESKKYPRLNTIGAFRKGSPFNATYDYDSRPADSLYGGVYTQEQLKALVQYAASRYITIIPEIEMPAHSRSVLAAYPQLACLDSAGNPFPWPAKIQDEFCTRDSTFTFLTDILSEVMQVFPSKYIHIAGDEAGKENWRKCPVCQRRMKSENLQSVEQLQSYFIKRIEKFVNEKGRTAIGWDEILEGGLAPNAVVMSWRGEEGGIEAAKQDHRVIMSPGSHCYFDHYQSQDPGEPPAFGGFTTLAKVYSYQPVPAQLTAVQGKFVMGAQGNLWTEYIPTYQQAEYMLFPRATALAEVGWSGNKQGYAQFISRLLPYLQRLDYYKVNYSRHLFEIRINTFMDTVANKLMATVAGVPDGYDVFYTTDGSAPSQSSQPFTKPVPIGNNTKLVAGVVYKGALADKAQKLFTINKGTGRPSSLKNAPGKNYNSGGEHAWNNGIFGSEGRFNDDQWLGWSGQDFEGTIDLQQATTVNTVSARFFNGPSSWVYMPSKVTVLVSDDGTNFRQVGVKDNFSIANTGVQKVTFETGAISARYVKVIANYYGAIPAGNPGQGTPAWLFVDEVTVD